METPTTIPIVGRIIGGVFGFVFFAIGCTVLIFLWSQPSGGFGSPPLFFRVVGSLISLAFVAMGGGVCFSALTGRGPGARFQQSLGQRFGGAAGSGRSYECPRCGAPLSEGADVSPSGDVRCTFCNAWFNVHGRAP